MQHISLYREGDLSAVWGTLLDDDKRELRGAGITDPVALEKYLLQGDARIRTWLTEKGEVAAVYGVTSYGKDAGLVWALPGRRAHARWRWASRHLEEMIKEVAGDHTRIFNLKDPRNTSQLRWLKRIGFTIGAETPEGILFERKMK